MLTAVKQQSAVLNRPHSFSTGSIKEETQLSTESSSTNFRNPEAMRLEQMELTEPVKILRVPNHLLETKTFAKVGQNELIQARPTILNFEGFEVGKKQRKTLQLLNASGQVLRMHIIPPQTRNFVLTYAKPARLVPGMTVDCIVEFVPDEWRYFYDCIRVHCPGEDNLLIPIHGYPVMSTKEFPRSYTFPSIPIGYSISKTFPLKSLSPIDFEFNFTFKHSHPAFSLHPISGIVPANSQAEVTVTFAPCEFQTASMVVELNISQFNSSAVTCTFIGSSRPGMLKEKSVQAIEKKVLDPKCVSPLDRARRRKQQMKPARREPRNKITGTGSSKMAFEKDGVQFPASLDNQHAVNKVLLQELGKLSASEIRENLQMMKTLSQGSTRQIKEAMFEQAVRSTENEERQNQLRWQVKLGDDPISAQERSQILEERNDALIFYKLKRWGEPNPEEEFKRETTSVFYIRTLRTVDENPPDDATFDIFSNDLWDTRKKALNRFVQAARTVIIRNRVNKRLPGLRRFMQSFSQTKELNFEEVVSPDERSQSSESIIRPPTFTADRVEKYKVPMSISPGVKDVMTPDALSLVPVPPTNVVIKTEVPFFDLQVPHQYKLKGYKKYSVSDAVCLLLPNSNRSLRTGAEDEIITVMADDFSPCQESGDEKGAKILPSELLSLKPPAALLKPMEYPRLHILNPAPGVQAFVPPLPFSEIDPDFHLCPLPRYPQAGSKATTSVSLDREDVIRGIMGWKKFPSPGLTTMSNTATLTNVWVPRWTDCFNQDLLPWDVPALMNKLDPEDAENCVECLEERGAITLTPDLVNAQFPRLASNLEQVEPKKTNEIFPSSSKLSRTSATAGAFGPVTKEQRSEELEQLNSKKYNNLGASLAASIQKMNGIISNPDYFLI